MSKTFKKPSTGITIEKNSNKSFIAPGAELDATLFKSNGSLEINGLIRGKLEVAQDMELLSEGVILGDINTYNAIISGSVTGTIKCSGFMEVTQTATIEGDIYASSIEVEHGAIINGMVTIRPGKLGPGANNNKE